MGAITGIMRYQEQRADNEINNDIETLTGLKSVFLEMEQEAELIKKQLSPNQIKLIKLTEATEPFFGTHPPIAKRVKKLDQRIALLEEDQKDEFNS